MNRFFVESKQIKNDRIEIIGSDVKHIKDALRLRVGDEIEVTCEGYTYIGEIENYGKQIIDVSIKDSYKGKNEPSSQVVLHQALAKGNKMEFILQKCTEVGVSEFNPIETGRTIVKIKGRKKAKSKINRWQEIVEQASKQSKRDRIPVVNEISSFEQMVKSIKAEDNILVPYEGERQQDMKNVLNNIQYKKIHLIIGPEGGFKDDEIEKLKEIGANIVTLGPRILRTETAGLVASTMILYELGDLGVV